MKSEIEIMKTRKDLVEGFKQIKALVNNDVLSPADETFISIFTSIVTMATTLDWILSNDNKSFDDFSSEMKSSIEKEFEL